MSIRVLWAKQKSYLRNQKKHKKNYEEKPKISLSMDTLRSMNAETLIK